MAIISSFSYDINYFTNYNGVFQYISMKDYLYKTKAQVLHERFHSLDFASVSKENIKDLTESDSQEILKNLWDKSMSVAIIDKNGDLLGERSNADTPTENNDWDSDTKGPTQRKINPILGSSTFERTLYKYL